MTSEENTTRSLKDRLLALCRLSLASWIIVGMVLGIAVGLFFGEICGNFQIVGDAFIHLLQMTVLPYIVVSLIHGIGGLTYKNARLLAVKGGLLMMLYWVISFVLVMVLPVIFPHFEQASFYSSGLIAQPPKIDYLALYIPSNPFNSLAENKVPAVVLFSLVTGVAVIGMKSKDYMMHVLDQSKEALTVVTHYVIKLTPIGVFAISASAAGTMTVDQFGRLQVYFAAYTIGTILVTFLILPMLVAMLTPFSYRKVMGISRDALVTSFTTGNLFVILPIIVENSRDLFEEQGLRTSQSDAYSDVIIPVTFNFPNIGKLLFLVFILFGGWFTGNNISVSQYPDFIFSGLLSFFGSTDVALPFLLDHFRLPADLFQLYMISGILIAKLATMIAAMNLLTFTLICTYSLTHGVSFNPVRVLTGIAGILGISIAVLLGGKLLLSKTVKNNFTESEMLVSMQITDPVPTKVHTELPKPGFFDKLTGPKQTTRRLEAIKKRGVLRVGYNPRVLPFAFLNKKGELVGLDVQMAHELAKELGCSIEFKPFKFNDIPTALDYGYIDIAMSCISVTPERIQTMAFTTPYLELSVALIVPGYRRDEFDSRQELNAMGENLTVAALRGSAYIRPMKVAFPKMKIIEIDQQEDFFSGKIDAIALLTSAEQGSAWTLIHPEYKVVIPRPGIMKSMVAYSVAKGDPDFLLYVNYWLNMSKINGDFDDEYQYWVLGEDKTPKPPRWCIARDVLHWMR